MSSHHIVRDEQEPALIIHRLEAFSLDHLYGLLEWSPTVICCEPALERYTAHGHKVDVALVSLAATDRWKQHLEDQQPVKIMAINDAHFLMSGLTILQKENHRAVNIITNEESVFDVIQLLDQWVEHFDLTVLAGGQRFVFVRKKTFKKWFADSTALQILTIARESLISTRGFDEDVDQVTGEVALGKKQEGEATIECSLPPFLIIEDL